MRNVLNDLSGAYDRGVRMSQGWTNQRLQRDELDMRQMEAEANKKRMAMIEQEFESNMALKKEEAARFVESEAAFERWGKATAAIDWSSPTARTEYEQATNLHLPTILKHDGARRKWEAMHGVTMKNAAYTDSKTAEIQLSDLAHKALLSGAGPDAIGIQADVKAGKISIHEGLTKLSEVMRTRDKELFERELQLRRISNPERRERPRPSVGQEYELKDLDRQIEEAQKVYDGIVKGGVIPTDARERAKVGPALARLSSLREARRRIAAEVDGGNTAAAAPVSSPASTPSAPRESALRKYKIEVIP